MVRASLSSAGRIDGATLAGNRPRAVSSPSCRARFPALLLALLFAGSAQAGPCSDDSFAQIGARPGLWAEQRDGAWLRVNGHALDGSEVRRFAYVGRVTDAQREREGAAVVRISRLRASEQDPVAERIALRRPDSRTTCGFRAWRLIQWRGLDFVGGQRVKIDTYIAHHMIDQDISSEITNFHIDYPSLTDGCVSTQKNKDGRRTAFLAETDGDAFKAGPAVMAQVRRAIGAHIGISTAYGATAGTRENGPATAVEREKRAFAAFNAVESQIHAYPLDGKRVCIAFAPAATMDRSAGGRWVIELVDLDYPSANPRRNRFNIVWQ